MRKEEMIEAVQSATAEVFSTMLGLEVEALPSRTDQVSPSVNDGVLAFVGIAGPWVGSGVISCNAAFACQICAAFLMTEAPAVNEDVLDAVGELANMIIGNFKTVAESQVGSLGLSVPTVVYGRNFTSRSLGTSDWVVMPFKCGADTFEIRVWFAQAAESSSPRHSITYLQSV